MTRTTRIRLTGLGIFVVVSVAVAVALGAVRGRTWLALVSAFSAGVVAEEVYRRTRG